jgi:hypothetical protein
MSPLNLDNASAAIPNVPLTNLLIWHMQILRPLIVWGFLKTSTEVQIHSSSDECATSSKNPTQTEWNQGLADSVAPE